MYSCLTTTQAILKTVTFRFQGTDALRGLSVTQLEDKKYDNDERLPLWGVESSKDIRNRTISDFQPLWGLVHPDLAANAVVGTRSLVGVPADQRPLVIVYNKRIRYHLPYAIPAIILLVFVAVTSMSTAYVALLGRTSLDKMKRYLNATSNDMATYW
ncbi:hypothetical protein VTI28DRAFT_1724 [Corynascus sepedonium]